MEFKFIENPGITAVNEIRDRLKAYNNQFWEVTDKPQYSLTVNEDGCLVGGLVFSVFGDWLELEFLWVDQDFGSITFPVGLDKAVTKYKESKASEYLKLIA